MPKVPSNIRHEFVDVQVAYPEFLDIGQGGKVAQDMAVEKFWGKYIGTDGIVYLELELLDQGKQTKLVHVPEWFGPQEFIVSFPAIGCSDKGAMEMENGGNVPGVTSQGACEETVCVVSEMGDDHFDDLLGKPGGKGRACGGNLWGSASRTRYPDSCQASVPNSLGE